MPQIITISLSASLVPLDEEDLIAVKICNRFHAHFLSRGAGTILAGQGNAAVILDFHTNMNKMDAGDQINRTVHVQPGIVLDRVREAAEEFSFTYAPVRPHSRCTLGGMNLTTSPSSP
jgi:FAD/FMN-containing dehydrogenase